MKSRLFRVKINHWDYIQNVNKKLKLCELSLEKCKVYCKSETIDKRKKYLLWYAQRRKKNIRQISGMWTTFFFLLCLKIKEFRWMSYVGFLRISRTKNAFRKKQRKIAKGRKKHSTMKGRREDIAMEEEGSLLNN